MTTTIDPVALHADIEARLRQDGQIYTRARRTIVHHLAAGELLTVPALLDLAPGLAQSTVYRILGQMEAAGIVTRHLTTGSAHVHYQLAKA